MKPNTLAIYNKYGNKKLFTTKNFDKLFTVCDREGDYVYGFDMLDESKFIKVYCGDVIEISPKCKLFKCLTTSNHTKVSLVEFMFKSVDEQAAYLEVSNRTMLRMKSITNNQK